MWWQSRLESAPVMKTCLGGTRACTPAILTKRFDLKTFTSAVSPFFGTLPLNSIFKPSTIVANANSK